MQKLNLRRFTFRTVRLAFGSATSLAIGALAFGPLVAHGEDVTVEFEGRIGVVPQTPTGYSLDPGVFVGAPFSGSYTLSTTNDGTLFQLGFMQAYIVWDTTGSIQIGSGSDLLSVVGSEDPQFGVQLVLIGNNNYFPPFGVFDSWTLAPLQSDAASGGAISSEDPELYPHYCQIFFAENYLADKLDGTDYFVNDTLEGWGLAVPATGQYFQGSIQCFAGSSVLMGFESVLFGGGIFNIRVVPPPVLVDIDLKPGNDLNCVKTINKASVPVGILGTSDLDVTQIDQSSLAFGGANPPQRCAVADLAPADGIPDLTCHFAISAVAWPAPGSVCGDVALTGALLDGRAIEGADTACLAGESACY